VQIGGVFATLPADSLERIEDLRGNRRIYQPLTLIGKDCGKQAEQGNDGRTEPGLFYQSPL
jgi:hypothetical protein